MTQMKPKMRLYDLITVLGVLLVLVWTPVYMAEGGGPEAPSAGHAFLLPDLHYGDHIEYVLVVQQPGQEAGSSPAFVSFEYREPVEDEAPAGAVLVESRYYQALNVDLGPVLLVQNARTETRFYDASGSLLQGHAETHRTNPDLEVWDPERMIPLVGAPGDPIIEQSDIGDRSMGDALAIRDTPIVYEPDTTWSALTEIFWPPEVEDKPGEEDRMGETTLFEVPTKIPDDERSAPFAAVHEGRVLYATDLKTPPSLPHDRSSDVQLQSDLFEPTLVWKDGGPPSGMSKAWKWWAEDLPVQAGYHQSFVEGAFTADAEPVLSLDVVPETFQRGEDPVPIDGETTEETLVQDDQELPSFDDPQPFIGNLSLARIHDELIGPDAPEGIRQRMQEEASFAGIVWESTSEGIRMLVALATQNATHVARIEYGKDTVVEDGCGRNHMIAHREVHVDCKRDLLGIEAKAASVQPVSELVPSLRRSLGTDPSEVWIEYGSYRLDLVTATPPGEGTGFRNAFPFHPMLPLETRLPVSVAHHSGNRLTAAAGSYEHHGREHKEVRSADNEQGIGSRQSLLPATAAAAPDVIGPFGPEPIYGGLVLLLLGFVVRLWAAVKAGAHLPLFGLFYAKIAKDKVLGHGHRETIAELVSADPGISLTEVAGRTGLSRTGAYHHLETLVRNDLLHVAVISRSRHYFPSDWKDPKARLRQAVTRREEWEKVMTAVEADPGAPLHALVERLDVGKSTVSRTGSRLAALGLVRKVRDGRETRFFPVTSSTPPTDPPACRDRRSLKRPPNRLSRGPGWARDERQT